MTTSLVSEWYTVSQQLEELRSKERELRQKVINEIFPNVPQDAEGTFSMPLGGGYKIKSTYSLTRKINEAALLAMRADFDKVGIDLDDVVQWTPLLKVSGYRKLNQEQRELIDEVITSKPGAVRLEIAEPKQGE
nr:MAG TPA: hypothetical protein [Caudoviricetes sp.]